MQRYLHASIGLALALASAGPPPARAQAPDAGAAAQRLTAGEWVLNRKAAYMGAAGCRGGETYSFSKSPQTVRVTRCVAGKWETSTVPWAVRAKPPTDVEVVMGQEVFVVKFREADGQRYMLLRSRAGEGKAATTSDREFRLTED